MFRRGDLTQANMVSMEEYQEPADARQLIVEMSGSAPSNEPDDKVSNVITVYPLNQFAGAQREATVMIEVDPTAVRDGTMVYRASPQNGWSYVPLDTQIIDGKAVAQTDRGGVFVAAVGLSTGAIVGVVISAIILILIATIVVGVIVYFVYKPEKWKSTKIHVKLAKKSFAKQI